MRAAAVSLNASVRGQAADAAAFAKPRLIVVGLALIALAIALWPQHVLVATSVGAAALGLRFLPVASLVVAGCVVVGVAFAIVPATTLACVLLGLVAFLAIREPVLAFLLVLLLFGAEGTLKLALSREGTWADTDPLALGAVLLDLALVFAVAGLVLRDRGDTPRTAWRNAGRPARVAIAAFAAWLLASVLQTAQGGDLVVGGAGFRLTQAYVVGAIAGLILLQRIAWGRERLIQLTLLCIGLPAAYTAVRALTGPNPLERQFALERPGVSAYGDVFRAVGSFSGAVGMASYLVPTAVFSLLLALLVPRVRVLGLLVFGCASVGIVASYARVGLVALVVGLCFGGALALAIGASTRTRKALLAVCLVVAVGIVSASVVVASQSSSVLSTRMEAFLDPGSDESLQIRLRTWERTIDDVRAAPFGSGVGTVGRASGLGADPTVTTDNSFLKILREQGFVVAPLFLLGLLALVATVSLGLRRTPSADRGVGIAALAGFVSFLALAVAGEYVEQPGKLLAWTLLGVAAWAAWVASARGPEPEAG
jgi:hypothetical protein